ncbi:hypothetical protein IT575_08980 [bacterium]|nr:hypothetical protein [bacterium]
MELDLKGLGVSLAIGSYFLIALGLLIHMYDVMTGRASFLSNLTKPETLPDKSIKHTMFITSFLCLALILGMAFEGMGDGAANRTGQDRRITRQALFRLDLDPKGDKTTPSLSPTPLCSALADCGCFHSYLDKPSDKKFEAALNSGQVEEYVLSLAGANSFSKQQKVLQPLPAMQTDQQREAEALRKEVVWYVEDLSRRLYYIAKNVVYLQDNYFQEMREIEAKVSAVLAFAGCSMFLLAIAWLLCILALIRNARDCINKRSPSTPWSHLAIYCAISTAYLLFTTTLAVQLYGYQEMEFNKRAFGYFSTLHRTGVVTPARLDQDAKVEGCPAIDASI